MPTSIQSAPARCEFRGGIESYCKAASSVLSPDNGRFVVCENWLNNSRVYDGAKEAGLDVLSVHPIKGNLKKQQNLFAVYVMKKKSGNDYDGNEPIPTQVHDTISVRKDDGEWTDEYKKIMESMSIPIP